MDVIDVSTIREKDVVKFITPDKTLFDGIIKKISDNCLGIRIDVRQNTFQGLKKDQLVELIVVSKHKAIKCFSTVLGCSQNDCEQAVIISIPKILLGIDRRELIRLPIVMDIEYSQLPAEVNYRDLKSVEAKYFRAFRKTYTVNISAGGIYFIVPKNEIDSKFALVSLSLKNEQIVTFCEKVRIDCINDSKYDKVAYKYNDIKAQHRQLILDFVSEKSKEISNG